MDIISQFNSSSSFESVENKKESPLTSLLRASQTEQSSNIGNSSINQCSEVNSSAVDRFFASLDHLKPTTGQCDFLNALAKSPVETLEKFAARQGLSTITQSLEKSLEKSPLPNKLVSAILLCIVRLFEIKKVPQDHQIFDIIERLSLHTQLSVRTSDLILQIANLREAPVTSKVLYDPLDWGSQPKPKAKKGIRFVEEHNLCQYKLFDKEEEPENCALTSEEKLSRRLELDNTIYTQKSALKTSVKGVLKKKELKKVNFGSEPMKKLIDEESAVKISAVDVKPMLMNLLNDQKTIAEKDNIIVTLKNSGQLDGIMQNIITLRRFIAGNKDKPQQAPEPTSTSNSETDNSSEEEDSQPVKRLRTDLSGANTSEHTIIRDWNHEGQNYKGQNNFKRRAANQYKNKISNYQNRYSHSRHDQRSVIRSRDNFRSYNSNSNHYQNFNYQGSNPQQVNNFSTLENNSMANFQQEFKPMMPLNAFPNSSKFNSYDSFPNPFLRSESNMSNDPNLNGRVSNPSHNNVNTNINKNVHFVNIFEQPGISGGFSNVNY